MQTIAAISTPKGIGGIGIVRVSGEDSIEIVNKLFAPYSKNSTSKNTLLNIPGYSAKLGKILFDGSIIDEAIVLVFRSPKSYTGENVVEISCHGGIFVLNKILDAVISTGARLAFPGEFTKRAVLNGKIDAIQAESVMEIIHARSESAAKLAILNKEGALSSKILKLKQELTSVIARISVSIDYCEDEDFSHIDYALIVHSLESIILNLEKLVNTYKSGKMLSSGIDTVIIGKPNVGKSSLMNILSGREKSIITNIPGTTRDVVEESVSFGDVVLNLKDTAGIRDSENLVEKIGIEKTLKEIDESELVLAMFDSSKEISENDLKIIGILKNKKNVIAILNKIDLELKINEDCIKNSFLTEIKISTKSLQGIESLKNTIKEYAYKEITDPEEGILTTKRQQISLINCLSYIKKSLDLIKSAETADILVSTLEFALNELLFLTGEKVSEIVTDEIFSKFCVGK